jgi:hypothetical protein
MLLLVFKLINLKGLKLPIENIIKSSFNYSHLVNLDLHQVMNYYIGKKKSLTTFNFNSITRYQPKLLKAHKPLKINHIKVPSTSSDKLLTIYIGSFLKPKCLLSVDYLNLIAQTSVSFIKPKVQNYLVEDI